MINIHYVFTTKVNNCFTVTDTFPLTSSCLNLPEIFSHDTPSHLVGVTPCRNQISSRLFTPQQPYLPQLTYFRPPDTRRHVDPLGEFVVIPILQYILCPLLTPYTIPFGPESICFKPPEISTKYGIMVWLVPLF